MKKLIILLCLLALLLLLYVCGGHFMDRMIDKQGNAWLNDSASWPEGQDYSNVKLSDSHRGVVTLSGTVETEVERESIYSAFLEHRYIKSIGKEIKLPEVFSPYTNSIEFDSDSNTISLNGLIPNEETRVDITNHIKSVFGDSISIIDNLTVQANPPKGWLEMAKLGINNLKSLKNGQFSLNDLTAKLTGEVDTEEALNSIIQTVNSELIEPYSADYNLNVAKVIPTVFSPYVGSVSLSSDRNVILEGLIPDEPSRSEIIDHVQSSVPDLANIIDNLTIQDRPPAGWVDFLKSNISALSKLSRGDASLNDFNSSLSGEAISDDIAQAIPVELDSSLADDYKVSYSITVPEPVTEEKVAAINCQQLFNDSLSGEKINFESASSVVSQSSYELLQTLSSIAGQCPSAEIQIAGHTDSTGGDDFNMKLSEERAKAVVGKLTEYGISPDRLTAFGFGETNPISDNTTNQGRSANRRIEFNVQGI